MERDPDPNVDPNVDPDFQDLVVLSPQDVSRYDGLVIVNQGTQLEPLGPRAFSIKEVAKQHLQGKVEKYLYKLSIVRDTIRSWSAPRKRIDNGR